MGFHTWLWTLFGDFGYRLRAGGGVHSLVARAVDAAGNGHWDILARLHILQPHGRGFEGLHPPSMAVGIDFQVGLGFVFLQLSVISVRHPAFIQAFILFPHFGNLKLVRDVIALDFHCLKNCRWKKKKSATSNDFVPIRAPKLANVGKWKGLNSLVATVRELFIFSTVKYEGRIYPIALTTGFTKSWGN